MALRKSEIKLGLSRTCLGIKNQHCLSIGRERARGEFVDFKFNHRFLANLSTALTFLVTFWVKPKSNNHNKNGDCHIC